MFQTTDGYNLEHTVTNEAVKHKTIIYNMIGEYQPLLESLLG